MDTESKGLRRKGNCPRSTQKPGEAQMWNPGATGSKLGALLGFPRLFILWNLAVPQRALGGGWGGLQRQAYFVSCCI